MKHGGVAYKESHRCEGSLKAGLSIISEPKDIVNARKGWYIYSKLCSDVGWDVVGLTPAFLRPIEYCPFCGLKLSRYWGEDEIFEANEWARKQGWDSWKLTLTPRGYVVDKI